MTAELKVGDMVKLRSGGPMMTVVALRGPKDTLIRCFWHPDNGTGYGEIAVPRQCLVLEHSAKEE